MGPSHRLGPFYFMAFTTSQFRSLSGSPSSFCRFLYHLSIQQYLSLGATILRTISGQAGCQMATKSRQTRRLGGYPSPLINE